MKHPFRFSILPYFTMGAGGIGLCLRFWLFSAIDEKGLLPASHIADPLLYILTALTLGVLFLATRNISPVRSHPFVAPVGHLLGAAGLVLYALLGNYSISTTVVCLAGAFLLLLAALFSIIRQALPYQLVAAITVILMVFTVTQCRAWGAIPQIQHYFFPLLASIFLILTAYHRTKLEAQQGKSTNLAFFSQGALFLCCLSINSNPLLYLGMACWAAVQLYSCHYEKKES